MPGMSQPPPVISSFNMGILRTGVARLPRVSGALIHCA
jgi:hypothetical protein